MIYYSDALVTIRTITESDPEIITREEIAQGWNATVEKYLTRLRDHSSGKAISLIAEYQGQVAGYINVYFQTDEGPFADQGLCGIMDFGVLEKYRRRGIGTKLMDIAEQIAGQYGDTVYLAVGLHSGYGSAQRMYVKRGYLPDGSGAWYGKQPATAYQTYPLDDDLVLYLSKKLR